MGLHYNLQYYDTGHYTLLKPCDYGMFCSKCKYQGHNLIYLDNIVQVGGVLRGRLSEKDWYESRFGRGSGS